MLLDLLLFPEDKEAFSHPFTLKASFTDTKNPTTENSHVASYISMVGGCGNFNVIEENDPEKQPKITDVSVVNKLVKVTVEFTYRDKKYTAICPSAFVVDE